MSQEEMQFIENLFRSLEAEMNGRFDHVEGRFDAINARLDHTNARSPWTYEELEEMKRRLEERIGRTEVENPNIRPLPPMALDETKEFLLALADTATVRVLTEDESFLHGQLVAAFGMAVRAETLGHSGRYYVISEQDIARVSK